MQVEKEQLVTLVRNIQPQGRKATVNPVLCKGDGLCNTVCATSAISLKHYTDEAIFNQIDAAYPAVEMS